jgi:DNA-directed RNA polymerase subunit RPC12/RpoP
MRYECERCGSIFIVGKQGFFEEDFLTAKPSSKTANKCPCGEGRLIKILDFETPEQYEARTGEAWPDNGAVYYLCVVGKNDEPVITNEWRTHTWSELKNHKPKIAGYRLKVICATEAGCPPDGWKPEETK